MKRITYLVAALAFLPVVALSANEDLVTVTTVVDGDTFKVQLDKTETVRIIGIDTPETVHPSKPVQCFGKEASAKLKELLQGKVVALEKNTAEDRDKYDRLLRYVNLDGEDIGARMIEEGYAYSYKQYPHPRLEAYNVLERTAREENRGLWGDCAEGVEFSDVSSSHPYIEAIRWGKQSGVLSGYPDGTFQPDKTVNRAEFLKIVLGANGADVGSTADPTGFRDMDENAWYAPYVRYAKLQGIIQGYPDGTFKPDQTVNFAEALKMAYVALSIDAPDTGGEWYERYLNHARSNNVLFSGNANVVSGMSRQDVVWIVWKLTQSTGQPPQPQSSSASSSVATGCTIKGNISTSGEKIYHVEGCGSYRQTVIDESAGERWFCSEQDAKAAGWRKADNC